MRFHAATILFVALFMALVCACGGPRPFTRADVMWEDTDRQPFAPAPEERFAPEMWDAADNMVFRPVARALAFDTSGESIDVNALDEVPDSSWFVNRIGRRPMSPEEIARGACSADYTPPRPPWRVVSSKLDGATAGFFFEDADGRRYLLKADRDLQPEQVTAADAIGAALYHAAGYYVPCNRVVFFEREWVQIDEDSEIDVAGGEPRPMTMEDLEQVFALTREQPDGTLRGLASEFVEGTPVGRWDYRDTWEPDLNDVVPHEDRRELRGMFVLNAWVDQWDARQQNTLQTWIERGPEGAGYVRHYLVDFGVTMGFLQGSHRSSTRYGHTQWLDAGDIALDLLTLGMLERPWDRAEPGPTWPLLGFFDVDNFNPDEWTPNYWNGAFERRTERDTAWMARIIARFRPEHLRRLVELGELSDPAVERRLHAVLEGRREKILERYLTRLSPLTEPNLHPDGRLCVEDLAVVSGIREPGVRQYRAWQSPDGVGPIPLGVARAGTRVCAQLPAELPEYAVVSLQARTIGRPPSGPLDVHVRRVDGRHRVVGLVRSDRGGPR